MQGFIERFFQLKRTGVEFKQALDIGAYRGEFTSMLTSVWPTCKVLQFEADIRNKDYLQDDAIFAILGDTERTVELYSIEDTGWGSTTGTSIFKENTEFYANSKVELHQMKTLDSLIDLSKDWSESLIKIDTQGSELLILKGAKELLKQNPKFIILECSYVEYNQGAPLIGETFAYMTKIGYKAIDILDNSYINGQLIQSDWLFQKL